MSNDKKRGGAAKVPIKKNKQPSSARNSENKELTMAMWMSKQRTPSAIRTDRKQEDRLTSDKAGY